MPRHKKPDGYSITRENGDTYVKIDGKWWYVKKGRKKREEEESGISVFDI